MSFLEIVMQLGDSTLQTLLIFALTLLFSIPLGVLICAMRMYAWKPLQWIPRLYISVLRGTPLMLQLLVVYFGPYFLFNISLSTSYRFYAVIIAFSLNYAAYFAEIFRSGIQSIPVGQYEASRILGYADHQTDSAGSHQRNHYAGKGHLACLCDCLHGIVHRGQADRSGANLHAALSGSGDFLLRV